MLKTITPPDLEDRFHPPAGWQWKSLAREHYHIRYGFCQPTEQPARGIVCIFPGLSEFCEKYFETAQELLSNGYGVLIIDWRGQGLSSRYLDNPHKRHSQGMDQDAMDFKAVLEDSGLADKALPLFMLAHSMGGNIGLRFLDLYPNMFDAAAFSAPLIGLYVFKNTPDFLASWTSRALAKLQAEHYAPMGGDWSPEPRASTSALVFSQDPTRAAVHNAWMLINPALQVGHITNQWLRDAYLSCSYIQNQLDIKRLKIPCLFAAAGHDTLVDEKHIIAFAKSISEARLIEIPDAHHEILMEKESIRRIFMQEFYSLINQITLN